MEDLSDVCLGTVGHVGFDGDLTFLVLGIFSQILLNLFAGRAGGLDASGSFAIRRGGGEVFGEQDRICFEHPIQLVINSIYHQISSIGEQEFEVIQD